MKLSVVIANWNGETLLDQCLESVYAQLSSLALEVIVVDNGSTDGSRALVLKKYPQVLLLENTLNKGPVKANNQGILKSTGTYILLLNTDAFPFDSSLHDIISYMDAHPRVGAAAPQLLNADGSLQESSFPLVTLRQYIFRHYEFILKYILNVSLGSSAEEGAEKPYDVPALSSACLVIRRAMLRETRLFDETFFIYAEDNDFFKRIAITTWRVIYYPAAQVIHFGGASSTPASVMAGLENFTLLRYETESWHYYYFKHFGAKGLRNARYIDISGACVRIVLMMIRMLIPFRFTYKWKRIKYDYMRIRLSMQSGAERNKK